MLGNKNNFYAGGFLCQGKKIGTGTGLLSRLIVGIFVPILLAFAFMGCILFLDINIGKFHFPSIKGIWLNSLNELGGASLKESTSSVNKLGEMIIRQQADDVAKLLEIHLKSFKKKTPPEKLFASNDPVSDGYSHPEDRQNRIYHYF